MFTTCVKNSLLGYLGQNTCKGVQKMIRDQIMKMRLKQENETNNVIIYPENKIVMSFLKSKNEVHPAVIAAMIFPGRSCWLDF